MSAVENNQFAVIMLFLKCQSTTLKLSLLPYAYLFSNFWLG